MRTANNFKMISRAIIIISTITFCLTNALRAYGQFKNKNSMQLDSSKIAIIPFEQKGSFPFDTSHKPTKLTQEDISNIDSLLIACISDYNNSVGKENKYAGIDLRKYDYKKQIIAVMIKMGKKRFG